MPACLLARIGRGANSVCSDRTNSGQSLGQDWEVRPYNFVCSSPGLGGAPYNSVCSDRTNKKRCGRTTLCAATVQWRQLCVQRPYKQWPITRTSGQALWDTSSHACTPGLGDARIGRCGRTTLCAVRQDWEVRRITLCAAIVQAGAALQLCVQRLYKQ
ncbi:unnamed protein product [Rodentolepis nana]|uniref:ADAM_CR_2 domain-containing protein n=1 Tax=Rodentolepis nana TaxID=102285 RepID=A0A0R3TTP3_RODNA|nr:unnamed protein product [Rodentolepis nana]